MAIPIKQAKINEIAGLNVFYNSGKGSGNFGHAGRPGKRGGSGSGSGVSSKEEEKKAAIKEAYDLTAERYALGRERGRLMSEYMDVMYRSDERSVERKAKLGKKIDKIDKQIDSLKEKERKIAEKYNLRLSEYDSFKDQPNQK